MFNILIDPLPKDYKGYLINWQFFSGILISQTLASVEDFPKTDFGQIERLYSAFEILYSRGIPNFEVALAGLNWFLSCDGKVVDKNQTAQNMFCFEFDKNMIFSAFMVKYKINLNKENNLHWFEFIPLLGDLDKTAFTNVTNLRRMTKKQIKSYSKEDQAEILKQQKMFSLENSLKVKYTKEEIKAIDYFDEKYGNK
jgi:hypothetical protein